jgi:hypothetical protein
VITLREGVDPGVLSGELAVYWRLPEGPWSIRVGSKVVAYADELTLTAAQFHVSQAMWRAGYEGTGKRGRKRNVVAWAIGKMADGEIASSPERRVTFRFFERGEFFDPKTGETFTDADVIRFDRHGRCWVS